MENLVPVEFVIENSGKDANVLAILLSDSSVFVAPHISHRSIDWSIDECEIRFILTGSSWIFKSRYFFMMSLNMLVHPLASHQFWHSKCTKELIVSLSVMNQLMPNDSVYRAKKAYQHCKSKIITICLWFLHIKPESWRINIITHYRKSPYPNDGLKYNEEVKWNVKPFVISEDDLWFGRHVFVISFSEVVLDWRNQVHNEHRKIEIVRHNYYDHSNEDHDGVTKVWQNISYEFRLSCHNNNLVSKC